MSQVAFCFSDIKIMRGPCLLELRFRDRLQRGSMGTTRDMITIDSDVGSFCQGARNTADIQISARKDMFNIRWP